MNALDLNFNYLLDSELIEFVRSNGEYAQTNRAQLVDQAIAINRKAATEAGRSENPTLFPFPYPTPAWIALDRATRLSYPATSQYTPEQVQSMSEDHVRLFAQLYSLDPNIANIRGIILRILELQGLVATNVAHAVLSGGASTGLTPTIPLDLIQFSPVSPLMSPLASSSVSGSPYNSPYKSPYKSPGGGDTPFAATRKYTPMYDDTDIFASPLKKMRQQVKQDISNKFRDTPGLTPIQVLPLQPTYSPMNLKMVDSPLRTVPLTSVSVLNPIFTENKSEVVTPRLVPESEIEERTYTDVNLEQPKMTRSTSWWSRMADRIFV